MSAGDTASNIAVGQHRSAVQGVPARFLGRSLAAACMLQQVVISLLAPTQPK